MCFLIVDEVSTIDSRIIAVLDFRFKQLTNFDLPFGGMPMFFCGDFCQLGPVMDFSQTAIDPDDDCTIWYVGDFLKQGASGYTSRIGAFRLPGCGDQPANIGKQGESAPEATVTHAIENFRRSFRIDGHYPQGGN